MPWFKVDDGFWSHPKVIDLPASAGWLWLRAGCYSSQHLTDGAVKASTLRMLGGTLDDADALVNAGLWDGKTDGYQFHDWERYQPPASATKAKRDEISQKRAEAGRKGAESRWHKDDNDDGNSDGNLPYAPDGNAIAPSRPDPSPKEEAKASSSRKKPETPLAADWVPTAGHYERAKAARVDVAKEAELFRLHAESKDRRAVNWNAAFTSWLIKAKPTQKGSGSDWALRM